MKRIIHELVQGSEEWISFRLEHDGASEAAAVLGLSKNTWRTELLRMKHFGLAKEFGEWVQKNILDYGHEVEAMARPIAEEIIGDELFPSTYSYGRLSASCDGLNMMGDTAFEHKQWSESLSSSILKQVLPDEHQPQCQQVMHVTGAERLLFMVSDGTRDKCAWMWVYPNQEWVNRIIAGWKQLAADLAAYQHVEQVAPAVAAPTMDLPSVSVQVSGSIALISNLDVFGARLSEFISGVNTKPEDDQAFADCEAAIKTLEKAESALKSAESGALAQTASIDEMRRTVALYVEQARTTRLMLEKMVKQRKETIRIEIQRTAQDELAKHVLGLNQRIGQNLVPPFAADWVGCMKGLKSIDSIRNKVSVELANAKIATSATADRIEINVKTIGELGFLFPDLQAVCSKSSEDFAALMHMRKALHQDQEDKKVAARVEQELAAKAAQEKREAERVAAAEKAANEAAARPTEQVIYPAQTVPIAAKATPFIGHLREKLYAYINQADEHELRAVCSFIDSRMQVAA